MMLRKFLGKIFFDLLWAPFQSVFFVCLNYKVKGKENLKEVSPSALIVINHTSWCDFLLAGGVFPFNSRFYPISFAVWHKLFYFPLFFPFMLLANSFPVEKGIGLDNSLNHPLKILKKGGVVGIFPEGRRRHLGRPRKGRRGAAYLALNANVPIVPIKIEGTIGLSPLKFFFQKRRVRVKIGKPFYLPQEMKYPENLDQATDLIVDTLRET